MCLSLSDIPPQKELVNVSYAARPLSNCFDIPSEGYTSPCIYQQLASNIITGIYLGHTPEYQISYITGIESFTTYSLELALKFQESQ